MVYDCGSETRALHMRGCDAGPGFAGCLPPAEDGLSGWPSCPVCGHRRPRLLRLADGAFLSDPEWLDGFLAELDRESARRIEARIRPVLSEFRRTLEELEDDAG
jgi:hypothetical protein